MANAVKDFHQYLTEATNAHVSHDDYLESPASAFLKYTIEAKSAIDLCGRHFPKAKSGEYTKNSQDSLQHLVAASLPTIMGHFETYQRYLFAGAFDLSVYLSGFDTNKFFELLSKETNIAIDWPRLAAHRGTGANSIGTLLADSMSGWHDPERVNRYFAAYQLRFNPYSTDAVEKLRVLWQLRHSIAHTGGTLTLADAQKVKPLNTFGGRQIAFEKQFTLEVARKIHPIVQKATEGFGAVYKAKLLLGIDTAGVNKVDLFFQVKSSIPSWLD
ncbi:MAG: hypothetical protein DWI04_02030 [Planctomycetota bacterium]|nr:MAG: hypothetical protein DWI04_02030 [Planctomycetota bacterium]